MAKRTPKITDTKSLQYILDMTPCRVVRTRIEFLMTKKGDKRPGDWRIECDACEFDYVYANSHRKGFILFKIITNN